MTKKDGIPVLMGRIGKKFRSSTGYELKVWCPYCRRDHLHGCDPATGRKPQHKVAHCGFPPASPFHERGYYVFPESIAKKVLEANQ